MECNDCKSKRPCFYYAAEFGVGFGIEYGFNADKCPNFDLKFSLIRLIKAVAAGIWATFK